MIPMEHRTHGAPSSVAPPLPIRSEGPGESAALGQRPDTAGGAVFNTMAGQHWDVLYRTALRLTGCPQEAEDLVQETYRPAQRSLHTYRPGTPHGDEPAQRLRAGDIVTFPASSRGTAPHRPCMRSSGRPRPRRNSAGGYAAVFTAPRETPRGPVHPIETM